MEKEFINTYAIKLITTKKNIFKQSIGSDKELLMFLYSIGLHTCSQEQFHVIYLSTDGWITGHQVISMGSVSTTTVHASDVFKGALLANAHRIALAHNHPHGSIEPSDEDIELTSRLKIIGDFMDIQVVEHYILTDDDYYSFKQNNLL